ncbi:hypothetical protein KAR34_09420 [bacterium]|nr:hypothetical protein [bacterium]
MKYTLGIVFLCISFLSLFQVAQGVAESTVLVEVGDEVPNFVIGKIKKKKCPVTMLMDWEQKVNKLLGTNKAETDVLIIAADGVLVSHMAGPYSEEKLQMVRDKLEEILETDGVEEKKEQKEGAETDAGKTNLMGG